MGIGNKYPAKMSNLLTSLKRKIASRKITNKRLRKRYIDNEVEIKMIKQKIIDITDHFLHTQQFDENRYYDKKGQSSND